jgi:hypothetical protein
MGTVVEEPNTASHRNPNNMVMKRSPPHIARKRRKKSNAVAETPIE